MRRPFHKFALIASCFAFILGGIVVAAPALAGSGLPTDPVTTSTSTSQADVANAQVAQGLSAASPSQAEPAAQGLSASSPSQAGSAAQGLSATSPSQASSVAQGSGEQAAAPAGASLAGGEATPTEIAESMTIKEGGTYQLATPLYDVTVTIATTEPVTIVGTTIDEAGAMYVTIAGSVPGIDLTLRDVFICNGTALAVPALSFTGQGNRLHVEGQSILQMCYTAPGAASLVNVPAGTDLTIDGPGELYLYRHTTDSATFGGADSCDNGSITVNGGTLRITGMSGGVAFGTSYPGGDFTINGGNVAINVEKGQAGIAGGATSGNVIVNGGTLSLEGDGVPIYAEPADGEGTLQVNGGRLIVAAESSALPQAFDSSGVSLTTCTFDVTPYLSGSNIANASSASGAISTGTGTNTSAGSSTVDAQSDSPCDLTVLVDGATYYAGSLDVATFNTYADHRGESTPLTWTVTSDATFTAYLTPEDHELTVNGTTLHATYDAASGFSLSTAPPSTISATASTTPVATFGLATFTCATDAENATYQWQYTRANSSTWLDLTEELQPGATTSSFSMEACPCRAACTFRCLVTAPDGQTAFSNAVGFSLVS